MEPASIITEAASERMVRAARVLRVLDAPRLGPGRFHQLISQIGDVAGVEDYLGAGRAVPSAISEHVKFAALDGYLSQLRTTVDNGARFTLWDDEDFPAALSSWASRPPILYYKGSIADLGGASLALVGRVDPTSEGLSEAARFAKVCVAKEFSVVSGLAKGIDGASHRGALDEPAGRTFAVVGHGLDHAYPAENQDLYDVIPSRGAVISQFPFGQGPQRWTFPARNELMCTLALGTVIVEGAVGCGSLIQADFSLKHGRPVFILRRNLTLADPSWVHGLVERGAHVVAHFSEVEEHLPTLTSEVAPVQTEPMQDTLFQAGPSRSVPDTTPTAAANRSAGSAVIFDVDGVLTDSRRATAHTYATLVARYTGHQLDLHDIPVVGAPPTILSRLGVPNASAVYRKEYDEAFTAACAEHLTLFEDALAGARQLADAGVRVAAVTAQPLRRAEAILPLEVRQILTPFLTHSDTGGKKEVGITKILSHAAISKQRAVYVGDQVKDARAAHAAGIEMVAVAWGFEPAEKLSAAGSAIVVQRPSELGTVLLNRLGISR